MEKESREVVTSKPFDFIVEIYSSLEDLATNYYLHPECRHLETKTKIYRIKNHSFLFIFVL